MASDKPGETEVDLPVSPPHLVLHHGNKTSGPTTLLTGLPSPLPADRDRFSRLRFRHPIEANSPLLHQQVYRRDTRNQTNRIEGYRSVRARNP